MCCLNLLQLPIPGNSLRAHQSRCLHECPIRRSSGVSQQRRKSEVLTNYGVFQFLQQHKSPDDRWKSLIFRNMWRIGPVSKSESNLQRKSSACGHGVRWSSRVRIPNLPRWPRVLKVIVLLCSRCPGHREAEKWQKYLDETFILYQFSPRQLVFKELEPAIRMLGCVKRLPSTKA